MILLDTHMWVWWVQGDARLSGEGLHALDDLAGQGIAVSVISCWEVAMLHARGRLSLPLTLDEWLDRAIQYPGVQVEPLTREVAVNSCRLPGDFH